MCHAAVHCSPQFHKHSCRHQIPSPQPTCPATAPSPAQPLAPCTRPIHSHPHPANVLQHSHGTGSAAGWPAGGVRQGPQAAGAGSRVLGQGRGGGQGALAACLVVCLVGHRLQMLSPHALHCLHIALPWPASSDWIESKIFVPRCAPHQIEERLGAASESLEALLADPAQHNSYDFAFIDADKKVSSFPRTTRRGGLGVSLQRNSYDFASIAANKQVGRAREGGGVWLLQHTSWGSAVIDAARG